MKVTRSRAPANPKKGRTQDKDSPQSAIRMAESICSVMSGLINAQWAGRANTMAKSSKIDRSAMTGKFTTVAKATRYPTTHVVERVERKPSCESSGSKKKS